MSMAGRIVVVTGASSGIGAATARALAAQGAQVFAVGRDAKRTASVARDLGTEPLLADFTTLDGVRELAATVTSRIDRIDVLVHNAGRYITAPALSPDGFELTMQTNYLSPWLLQHELHDLLSASRAHLVVTSSQTHRMVKQMPWSNLFGIPSPWRLGTVSYAQSKLANAIWASTLARRSADTGMTAVSFHPGNVRTPLNDNSPAFLRWLYNGPLGRPFTVDTETGAQPAISLASTTDAASLNGAYFHELRRGAKQSPLVADAAVGDRLWRETAAALGVT